ncbi:MAG: D-alanyl-D-alanine carboxypeptidase/D-alanyl-D-alanine-endopeptidase [Bacteroidota bacterium]
MSKKLRIYILFTAIFFGSFTFFLRSQEVQEDQFDDDDTTAQDSVPVTFGINNLQARLEAIFANPALKNSKFGASVYSVDKNRFYFQKNGDQLLTPASTTKLFSTYTAFATMDTFGIKTSVHTDGVLKNGVLNGNLYVVGRGDAFLNTPDIELLADQFARIGIKKITGSVFADKSFFDENSDRFRYSGDRDAVVPIPPVEAFSLNQNKVTVLVSSSSISGAPLRVQTIPVTDAFSVSGQVYSSGEAVAAAEEEVQPEPAKRVVIVPQKKLVTAKTSRKAPVKKQAVTKKASVKKKVVPAKKAPVKKPAVKSRKRSDILNEDEDYRNRYGDMIIRQRGARRPRRAAVPKPTLIVTSEVLPSGVQNFIVRGTLPPNTTKSYTFTIKHPELAVAGMLRSRLIASGTEVAGQIGVAARPEKARQIAEFKRPLVNTISIVNKMSNNWLAEHIFRMVGGFNNTNKQPTAKSASAAIFKALADAQIPCTNCVLNDGSGLSRRNLLTTNAEALLLASAVKQPWGEKYISTMSIVGEDGTLRKRMRGTAAEKNIKAKTGTLNNVSALAGYVRTADGELLSFSVISNGGSVGLYKQIENQVGATLAGFSGKQ